MLVSLSRAHNLRWKLWMVHCIREPLSLQTQCSMLSIHNPTLTLNILQEVGSVELHPWLITPQLKCPARPAVPTTATFLTPFASVFESSI